VENFNINEIWANLLIFLENKLSKDICEMWIKPMKPLSFDNGIFKIELPNEVWLRKIKERYETPILQGLNQLINEPLTLEYIVPVLTKPATPRFIEPEIIEEKPVIKNPFESHLNSYFTFDGFIEGPSNRFAYKAAQAVVKKLGDRANNPFIIFSAPGLGKTHLLHAIGNQILKDNPYAKVLYMSGEGFVSEYIESLQNKKADAFRKKYRHLDCLLLDDIQFVVGKESSEQEFFYTFNSLFDNRKQIVLTSDRTPNQLGLSERLASRILSGLVTEIKRPDLETRLAILRQKRDFNNFDIGDDVLAFIASGVQASIRELEGCLFRLTAYCSIHGVQASVSIAKEVLADIISSEQEKYSISISQIKRVVCKYFKISVEDINSKKKSNSIAWPRQVAMYIASELTTLPVTEIGREFNRDHTTILHAKQKVKEEIENNPFFVPVINQLINDVKSVDNN
jgi:chromosomal replication initiator protein